MRRYVVICMALLSVMLFTGGCESMKEENMLTPQIYQLYIYYYKLDCNQNRFEIDIEEELIITASDYTKKILDVYNYMLSLEEGNDVFNMDSVIIIQEECANYGFGPENPITEKWVLENPFEALSLIAEDDEFHHVRKKYKTYYEAIVKE